MIGDALERARAAVARRLPKRRLGPPLDAQERAGEPPAAPPRAELVAEVAALGGWYQRIYLGRGVYTLDWPHPAYHETVWDALSRALPADLAGASVLDVGTNAGYFALQAKRRGAGRVLGIEPDPRYLAQAELCRRVWQSGVEYRALAAEQLGTIAESFDVVLFTGILYHLKGPLTVLEDVGRLCRDAIVVETEVIPEHRANRVRVRLGAGDRLRVRTCRSGLMKLVEGDELNGDPSNWWVPDTACVAGMLRAAGFRHVSTPCYPERTRLLIVATKQERSLVDRRAIDGASRPGK
ncbi:MAG TPA: DUF1698 domain-containing protein [Candidatus Binatia bacterium]|nr:DUF1698 domain-containing protein [Candidatus Binatia bacterium]